MSFPPDPTRRQILYAGTSGGVYKSVDQAGHWEKVNNGLVPPGMVKTSRALNVTSILVDPFEPDTVYAATLSGLYKTVDGGQAFNPFAAEAYRVFVGQLLYHDMSPEEVKTMAAHGIAFAPPQIDIDKLRAHKDKVVGKLTGGLAGMAKAQAVEKGLGLLDSFIKKRTAAQPK